MIPELIIRIIFYTLFLICGGENFQDEEAFETRTIKVYDLFTFCPALITKDFTAGF